MRRKTKKRASRSRRKVAKRKVVKRKTTKRKKSARKAKRKAGKRKSSRKGGLTKMTYEVSSDLASVIGTKKATRPQIVKKLWAYIKAKKCQDSKNKRMIVPDSKLSKIIGNRPVDMLKLATHISKHIKK